MDNLLRLLTQIRNQRGITIVVVAFLMVAFLGFAALAVDINHLFVVRNELQNASDAGALAGARFLYLNDGTAVNPMANGVAYDAATANRSEGSPVESNPGDIERGHWSFGIGSLARGFYPNESWTQAPDLWNKTTAELDADLNFINAVRVRSRRESLQAASYFARIFGYMGFGLNAEAVAYIGFAGTLQPFEVDQPIAICKQALLNAEGEYTCGVGRMINSGANTGHQTGGWTNLTQPCSTANVPSVRPLVCGPGNPDPIVLEQGMGTVGGMQETVYDQFIGCWQRSAGLPWNPNSNDPRDFPTAPWAITLPVIDCPGNNLGPCTTVVGSVELNVIWITRTGFRNSLSPIPQRMAGIPGVVSGWVSPGLTPQQNWDSFVTHFRLQDVLNNSNATPEDKTIYFLPDCAPHVPAGQSGGENFGILAKIPVLVR